MLLFIPKNCAAWSKTIIVNMILISSTLFCLTASATSSPSSLNTRLCRFQCSLGLNFTHDGDPHADITSPLNLMSERRNQACFFSICNFIHGRSNAALGLALGNLFDGENCAASCMSAANYLGGYLNLITMLSCANHLSGERSVVALSSFANQLSGSSAFVLASSFNAVKGNKTTITLSSGNTIKGNNNTVLFGGANLVTGHDCLVIGCFNYIPDDHVTYIGVFYYPVVPAFRSCCHTVERSLSIGRNALKFACETKWVTQMCSLAKDGKEALRSSAAQGVATVVPSIKLAFMAASTGFTALRDKVTQAIGDSQSLCYQHILAPVGACASRNIRLPILDAIDQCIGRPLAAGAQGLEGLFLRFRHPGISRAHWDALFLEQSGQSQLYLSSYLTLLLQSVEENTGGSVVAEQARYEDKQLFEATILNLPNEVKRCIESDPEEHVDSLDTYQWMLAISQRCIDHFIKNKTIDHDKETATLEADESCSICLDTIEASDDWQTLSCRHRIHKDCLKQAVCFGLNNESLQAVCKCWRESCKNDYSLEDIAHGIADPIQIISLQKQLIRACPSFRICPLCDEGVVQKHSERSWSQRCPQCQKYLCFNCAGTPHPGRTCEEAIDSRKSLEVLIAELDEATLERMGLCPHCGMPVEKIDGCDDMVCGKNSPDKEQFTSVNLKGCGKEFSWEERIRLERD